MKYRLGKKQKRAILTEDGHEVVIFSKGRENLAELVCRLLNEHSLSEEKDKIQSKENSLNNFCNKEMHSGLRLIGQNFCPYCRAWL